jgi:hypothetical protein
MKSKRGMDVCNTEKREEQSHDLTHGDVEMVYFIFRTFPREEHTVEEVRNSLRHFQVPMIMGRAPYRCSAWIFRRC